MTSRTSTVTQAAVMSAASLFLLAACWTSTETGTDSGAAATPTAAATDGTADGSTAAGPTSACPAGSPDATSYECVGLTVTGAKDAEPTIKFSAEFGPVEQLQVADVFEGSGTPVSLDDTLTVQYVGMGEQTRAIFDSSWSAGQPATFPLSGVIEGWQEGLIGMQPGGRRLLVIPASLGYGADGIEGVIQADETLVFVVDLVSATPAS